MYYKSGAKYEGDWKQNLREGYGTHVYSTADKYEGNWKGDKQHGK